MALIKELSVQELANWLNKGQNFLLIDVRPKQERDLAFISFAKALTKIDDKEKIDKNCKIVFHCHHGRRSLLEGLRWQAMGFKNIYNLTGGIDAWSLYIDKSVPRY